MKGNFFKQHSSTILTCVGAIGVIATAVIAVKDTPKAVELLEMAEEEKGEALTKAEIIKTAAPAYIPAAAVCVSTIACIFGANMLNKRSQAALMSAYAMLDQSYKEYRRKVTDMLGEETNQKLIEEMAKETRDDSDSEEEKGNVITIFDGTTMLTFETTLDKIVTDDGMEIYCIETPLDALWPDNTAF